MTICIAALAEEGKKLVVASDQMITANVAMSYEYETSDVQKIHMLPTGGVALIAGNALYASEIIRNTCKIIRDNNIEKIEQIAEVFRKEFQRYRLSLVVQNQLEPRGLSLQDYYNLQNTLNVGLINLIDNNLANWNMGVELIIAGRNTSEDYHIYSVGHPGTSVSHDAVGYVCIGSGAPHAMYYLIGSEYKKALNVREVETIVKEAKKKSEVAPGVGKATRVHVFPTEEAQPDTSQVQ